MSCIEKIVSNDNLEKEMKCAMMTKMCRDIFQKNNFKSSYDKKDKSRTNIIVAMIAGIIGVGTMIYSMRWERQPEYTEIELSSIPDRSIS